MTFSSNDKLYEDFKTPNETVYDTEAIKNSIKNILLTPIGTMPGKPDFGSRLLEIPFNQNDVSTRILVARVIYEALTKWEQRIFFTGLDVKQNDNRMSIKVLYRFRDSTLSGSVSLDLFE